MGRAPFRICCNCGARAPRRKRFCNAKGGCGPVDRRTRRLSKGSIWREPTAEELAARRAEVERLNRLIDELAQEEQVNG